MKRLTMMALLGAALVTAAPAYAAPPPTPTPTNDPCSYAVVTGAVACVGYYGGNLLTGTTGSATTATEQTYINQLLAGSPTSSGAGYTPPYSLSTGTVLGSLPSLTGTAGSAFVYDFSPLALSGYTVFAAHFGNSPYSTSPDVTAFWLLNLGSTPTSTITIGNGQGVSNAQIFATGAVPEPATWAMMLLGFGGMGMTMRRRRKPALAQIA